PAQLLRAGGSVYVEFKGCRIRLPKSVEARIRNEESYVNTGRPVVLGIRPEDIHDEENFLNASPDTIVRAYVDTVEKLGAETLLNCRLGEEESPAAIGAAADLIARVDPRSKI